MEPLPTSPSLWPIDDEWLDGLDVLLPIEISSSSAFFQAGDLASVLPTAALATPQSSNSSGDKGEEPRLTSKNWTEDTYTGSRSARSCLSCVEHRASSRSSCTSCCRDGRQCLLRHINPKRRMTGWRGVALRQMQRRIAAEALNRELRNEMRTRHEATVGLVEAMRVQMAGVQYSRAVELSRGEPTKPAIELSEKDVWDLSLLLRDIDGLCAQASAEVLQERMPQLETDKLFKTQDSRDIRAISSERSATYAETMAVPFPFLEAKSAIDKAFISMISSECIPAVSEVAAEASTVAYKHVWGQFEVLSICRTIGDRTHSDRGNRSSENAVELQAHIIQSAGGEGLCLPTGLIC